MSKIYEVRYMIVNDKGDVWYFTNTSKLAKFISSSQGYVNLCIKEHKPCKGWTIREYPTIINTFDEQVHKVDPNEHVEYFYNLWQSADVITCDQIRKEQMKWIEMLKKDGKVDDKFNWGNKPVFEKR